MEPSHSPSNYLKVPIEGVLREEILVRGSLLLLFVFCEFLKSFSEVLIYLLF